MEIEGPCDFETAITATKFGKFNILLYLLAIPAAMTSVFETTTMSYVFPAAHCHLKLTLNDKGSLNAITFLGMVSSGFIWGYLCDTFGRKKLMVVGYLLDAAFVLLSSFSQNFIMLMVFKFFGGFIINGPFAGLTTYLPEFHRSKYRSRVLLFRGMIVSCGAVILPVLAWGIMGWDVNLDLKNNVELHSWNFYLMACAVPSLISGILFSFMPESPKFLMTMGRTQEALAVFQLVFKLNTGSKKEDYPVKELIDETKQEEGIVTANRSNKQALKEGCAQIKPLCLPPHLKNIILICTIQSFIFFSMHTLRLWSPQIFQSISDYQYYNNNTTASLCKMLKILTPSKNMTCHVNFSPSVYYNNMIIAGVTICGYAVAGTLINKVGKKILLSVLTLVGGSFASSIFFSQNTDTVLALLTIFLSFSAVCGNVILSVTVDAFPTTIRTFTVGAVMICGRSAAMIGNLIFPELLKLGCAPPFFVIGSLVIACSFLTILLPNTERKALV